MHHLGLWPAIERHAAGVDDAAEQAFADQRYLIALAVTVVWTTACLLGSMARVEKRDRGAPLSVSQPILTSIRTAANKPTR